MYYVGLRYVRDLGRGRTPLISDETMWSSFTRLSPSNRVKTRRKCSMSGGKRTRVMVRGRREQKNLKVSRLFLSTMSVVRNPEVNHGEKIHAFVSGGCGGGGGVRGTGWRARDRHTSNRSPAAGAAAPVRVPAPWPARARDASRMRRAHAYECPRVSVRARRRRPSPFLPFGSRHGSADRRAPNPLPPVAAAAADWPALPRAAAHPVVRRRRRRSVFFARQSLSTIPFGHYSRHA